MFLLNYPSLRTCSAGIGFSTQRVGFFHDEIESPERVTISVIILSESLLTSRIIAHSVKNSIEFLSQKWGFYGFCLLSLVPCHLVTLIWVLLPTRPVVKDASSYTVAVTCSPAPPSYVSARHSAGAVCRRSPTLLCLCA